MPVCHTLSKAFWISRKTAPVDFRYLNPVLMYSTTRRIWCDVESSARKPCCWGMKMSLVLRSFSVSEYDMVVCSLSVGMRDLFFLKLLAKPPYKEPSSASRVMKTHRECFCVKSRYVTVENRTPILLYPRVGFIAPRQTGLHVKLRNGNPTLLLSGHKDPSQLVIYTWFVLISMFQTQYRDFETPALRKTFQDA
ncbi:hypothetical protein TNCV_3861971 [Trichonephila clavipes]|nr:hypothetical protein TNCV_3861971 [Trichonephila clavipes]